MNKIHADCAAGNSSRKTLGGMENGLGDGNALSAIRCFNICGCPLPCARVWGRATGAKLFVGRHILTQETYMSEEISLDQLLEVIVEKLLELDNNLDWDLNLLNRRERKLLINWMKQKDSDN